LHELLLSGSISVKVVVIRYGTDVTLEATHLLPVIKKIITCGTRQLCNVYVKILLVVLIRPNNPLM